MNKSSCRKSHFILLLLTGWLVFFNAGCGLDTFYVIESPDVIGDIPTFDNIEEDSKEFKFLTEEHEYEGIKFLGTEVYYKIYASPGKLSTEVSKIRAIAESADSTNQSADLMITYKYQPLRSSENIDASVLVSGLSDKSNKRVYIRLADNKGIYESGIYINDVFVGKPVRSISGNPSFNFSELYKTAPDLLPKGGEQGDADYSETKVSGDDENDPNYYVSMFAVAVASLNTSEKIFSNVLYLGSVAISLED